MPNWIGRHFGLSSPRHVAAVGHHGHGQDVGDPVQRVDMIEQPSGEAERPNKACLDLLLDDARQARPVPVLTRHGRLGHRDGAVLLQDDPGAVLADQQAVALNSSASCRLGAKGSANS